MHQQPSPTPAEILSAARTDFNTDLNLSSPPDSTGLRLGLVLRQSLRILRTRFGFWLVTGLIAGALAVPIVVPAVLFVEAHSDVLNAFAPWWLYFPIVAPFQTIIVHAAFRAWCNEDFRFADALQQGWRRILPVLGILALTLVAAVLGLAVVFVLVWLLYSLLSIPDSPGFVSSLPAIAPFAGLIFLLVASTGMVKTSAAIPACVVEGLRPLASLRRSFQLTKGHSLTIVAAFLTIPIAAFLYFTILFATGVLVFIYLPDAMHTTDVQGVVLMLSLPFLLLLLWFPAAFFSILSTSIYANLRLDREGRTSDRTAGSFD